MRKAGTSLYDVTGQPARCHGVWISPCNATMVAAATFDEENTERLSPARTRSTYARHMNLSPAQKTMCRLPARRAAIPLHRKDCDADSQGAARIERCSRPPNPGCADDSGPRDTNSCVNARIVCRDAKSSGINVRMFSCSQKFRHERQDRCRVRRSSWMNARIVAVIAKVMASMPRFRAKLLV